MLTLVIIISVGLAIQLIILVLSVRACSRAESKLRLARFNHDNTPDYDQAPISYRATLSSVGYAAVKAEYVNNNGISQTFIVKKFPYILGDRDDMELAYSNALELLGNLN